MRAQKKKGIQQVRAHTLSPAWSDLTRSRNPLTLASANTGPCLGLSVLHYRGHGQARCVSIYMGTPLAVAILSEFTYMYQ